MPIICMNEPGRAEAIQPRPEGLGKSRNLQSLSGAVLALVKSRLHDAERLTLVSQLLAKSHSSGL